MLKVKLGSMLLLLLLWGAVLLCAGCGQTHKKPKGSNPITLEAADEHKLTVTLLSFNNKVVLVDFWATWCVPCMAQFPKTVALHNTYKDQGFTVVSVTLDDEEEHAKALAFLKKQNAAFPNFRSAYGASSDSMTAFEITGGSIPHYKLYDKNGTLRHTLGGEPGKPVDPEDLIEKIEKLLAK